MFDCFVCKATFRSSSDLNNHMQRHRKVDLINAANKLPKFKQIDEESKDSNSCCSHSHSSSCTSACIDDSADCYNAKKRKRVDTEKILCDLKSVKIKQENLSETDENVEVNNNCVVRSNENNKSNSNLRRSCRINRLKDIINHSHSSSCDLIDKDISCDNLEDNYYIPPSNGSSASHRSVITDDSDEDDLPLSKRPKMKKKCLNKSDAKNSGNILLEPVLSTPKIEKEPTSETDSCSGNALSEQTVERMFCSYCGSGYRTQAMLADHIRHNHNNFCSKCDENFSTARLYKEHSMKHKQQIFVCPYCSMDFHERALVVLHVQRHLQDKVLDDVLSLEEEYFNERSYMNTMYNMFNAGYMYGRSSAASSSMTTHPPTEFYQFFLQYATHDVERIDRYGYLCRTCGFTLFDRSHYRDHMQIAHGLTSSDVDNLLSI